MLTMWAKLFICGLAVSTVLSIPTKEIIKENKDQSKIQVTSITEELEDKLSSKDKGTVEVIELAPELEGEAGELPEDFLDGVVEFIEITPDGQEQIDEVSIRELMEEDDTIVPEVDEEIIEVTEEPIIDNQEEEITIEDEEEEGEVVEIEVVDVQQMDKHREILVSKDNIFPLLNTLILASTHKQNPTYQEILKAGAVSALKTTFSFMSKEKLSNNILQLVKRYTSILNDDECTEDEESLAQMAEEYLNDHKFKILIPESVLLHQPQMEQFVAKKKLKDSGREMDTEYSIAMPRADPGVTTLLSIGPVTWLALLGAAFSIPYFISEDETERSDRPAPLLLRPPEFGLRAPPHQFGHHPQLIRRPEGKPVLHRRPHPQQQHKIHLQQAHHLQPPPPRHENHEQQEHQQQQNQEQQQQQFPVAPTPAPGDLKDPEYQAYLKEYEEWYSQWYYHYYAQHFGDQPPEEQQLSGPQIVNPQQNPAGGKYSPLNPHLDAQQIPAGVVQERHQTNTFEDHSLGHSANVIPQQNTNTFGTIIPEKQRIGNSHFKVTQINEANNVGRLPGTTSLRPVYQPVTPASTGNNKQNTQSSPTPKPSPVGGFSAPKTGTLLNKHKDGKKPIIPSKVPSNPKKQPLVSRQPVTAAEVRPSSLVRQPPLSAQVVHSVPGTNNQKTADKIATNSQQFKDLVTSTGFKPIVPNKDPVAINNKPSTIPTVAPHISGVTSGVFKTTARPTAAAATTPNAASVFVKTSTIPTKPPATRPQTRPTVRPTARPPVRHTARPTIRPTARPTAPRPAASPAVRVVTSTSVVTSVPYVAPGEVNNLPDLKRPQRHQLQERPVPQQTLVQRPPPVTNGHQNTHSGGFVKTNVPTKIRVVSNKAQPQIPKTTTTTTTPQPGLPIYALDPFYGPRLSRVDAIFHQLNQDIEGCREQVVCNMYKNPDVYTPLSDFLSRQLTVTMEELQRPKVSDPRILRFFRYLQAAKQGQDGNDCVVKYPDCPEDTTRLSHRPIMDAFKKVSVLMNQSNG